MASGFGFHGVKGRCYDLFMDFRECMSRCELPKDCNSLGEDYFECLHHKKEMRRNQTIAEEKARQDKARKNKNSS